MSISLPSVLSVSRLACRLGASAVSCRASVRALGGFVLCVGFRSGAAAGRAARRFAALLPSRCRGVRVRRHGGFLWLSVPVIPGSVPAIVAAGVPLSSFGSPPSVRSSVVSSPAWAAAPAPAPASSGVVGFSGSRSLPSSLRPDVSALCASVLSSGRGVAVGCASGLDYFVRSSTPSASVFRTTSRRPSALVARSAAMVRAVAASGPGRGLVVFPDCPCPAGLLPSASSSRCFCGLGSGSWASAAFAAGLNVPVVIFGVPRLALPSAWGRWIPAGPGAWAAGFLLIPDSKPHQLSLF